MTKPPIHASTPPPAVLAALADANLLGPDDAFVPLAGGRTNQLWRFRGNAQSSDENGVQQLVVKLYTGAATPLFRNDPAAELAALTHLSKHGLAPKPCLQIEAAAGPVLVYEYLDGPLWQGDVAAAAHALRSIHQMDPGALVSVLPTELDIFTDTDHMVGNLGHIEQARLRQYLPVSRPSVGPVPAALIHGDPVPANMITTKSGICFIDWQCPRLGDPCEDIALFLSPAMQELYNGRCLSKEQTAEFFAAYDMTDVKSRYKALTPWLHVRIAAYCAWRAAQGSADYTLAFSRECALLDRI